MNEWIVMARVSGGVTGTHEAPLKGPDGKVKEFDTEADAQAEADRVTKLMNGNPYSMADFRYWPVRWDAPTWAQP